MLPPWLPQDGDKWNLMTRIIRPIVWQPYPGVLCGYRVPIANPNWREKPVISVACQLRAGTAR